VLDRSPPLGNNYESVNVIWGIKGIDRATANTNDPFAEFLGEVIYDPSFNLSDPAAQQHLLTAANWISAQAAICVPDSASKGRMFIKDFAQFSQNHFPVPPNQFEQQMYAFLVSPNYQHYVNDLGIVKTGKDSYRIRWARMSFVTQLDWTVSSFDAIKLYYDWEDAMTTLNSQAPSTANHAIETTDLWMRVITEVVAVYNIIYGLCVSSGVAIVGTLLFTGNLVLTALVTLTLIGTVVCSLAFFHLMGWTLGAIEAISITVLVGLSVDYTLHIADSYGHSLKRTRYGRAREALTHIGLSVVGGALTTVASACMLLFCTIEIFSKFGLIITVNTGFSILLTLFLFCPLLMTMGPNHLSNNHGDVGMYVKQLWRRIAGGGSPPPQQTRYSRVASFG